MESPLFFFSPIFPFLLRFIAVVHPRRYAAARRDEALRPQLGVLRIGPRTWPRANECAAERQASCPHQGPTLEGENRRRSRCSGAWRQDLRRRQALFRFAHVLLLLFARHDGRVLPFLITAEMDEKVIWFGSAVIL
jgi:hypothetical protein